MFIRNPPPIPLEWQLWTPTQSRTAIAASTAEPPKLRIRLNEREEKHGKIIFSAEKRFECNYLPTFDASSESEATAPCLHLINDDSPSNP